jgi:hypothetical protein
MGVLALLVLAGLCSLLGVHTTTATATANGWTLTLNYPRVARAGLDVQWQATVSHPGGFGNDITLAITGDYFNIYETQGFHPSRPRRPATTAAYTSRSPLHRATPSLSTSTPMSSRQARPGARQPCPS